MTTEKNFEDFENYPRTEKKGTDASAGLPGVEEEKKPLYGKMKVSEDIFTMKERATYSPNDLREGQPGVNTVALFNLDCLKKILEVASKILELLTRQEQATITAREEIKAELKKQKK